MCFFPIYFYSSLTAFSRQMWLLINFDCQYLKGFYLTFSSVPHVEGDMIEMWVLFFIFKEHIAGVQEHRHKVAGRQHKKAWLNAKLCNTEDYRSKTFWVEHRLQKETKLVWTVWPWVNYYFYVTHWNENHISPYSYFKD